MIETGQRNWLWLMYSTAVEWLFPRSEELKRYENLTAEQFFATIKGVRPIPYIPNGPNSISHIQSLFKYNDPFIRQAVWQLKYRGDLNIARLFAEFLARELRSIAATYSKYGMSKPLLFIPMPSSRKRRRERGWNQTFLIAEALKELTPAELCEVRLDILVKTHHTVQQTKLSRRDRKENLSGCFGIDKKSRPTLDLNGRVIVLFDDVLTTGTTLREAAKALQEAGGAEMIGLTIAH